jgi:hypothetical protein
VVPASEDDPHYSPNLMLLEYEELLLVLSVYTN